MKKRKEDFKLVSKKGDTMKLPKDFWRLNLMDTQVLCCLLEMGFDKKLEKKCRKRLQK